MITSKILRIAIFAFLAATPSAVLPMEKIKQYGKVLLQQGPLGLAAFLTLKDGLYGTFSSRPEYQRCCLPFQELTASAVLCMILKKSEPGPEQCAGNFLALYALCWGGKRFLFGGSHGGKYHFDGPIFSRLFGLSGMALGGLLAWWHFPRFGGSTKVLDTYENAINLPNNTYSN